MGNQQLCVGDFSLGSPTDDETDLRQLHSVVNSRKMRHYRCALSALPPKWIV